MKLAERLAIVVVLVTALIVKAGAQSQLHVLHGTNGATTGFGTSVASAGDVDNDGHDDVIIGAPLEKPNGSGSGQARVCSGKDGSVLRIFNGDAPEDQAGFDVDGLGDLNGDGHADVVVALNGSDLMGMNSGTVRVFSGSDSTVIFELYGTAFSAFGYSVAGVGDVDADGTFDFAVGAPDSAYGIVRVISGRTGSDLWTFQGDSLGDYFGKAVDGAGDVDFDGHADVVVGADQSTHDGKGYVRVFSGLTGLEIFTATGDALGDRFGSSVSGERDVDNDGVPDVIVGAPQATVGPSFLGLARILSGADGGIIRSVPGPPPGGVQFGNSVALVDDLDRDEYFDYFVGAPSIISSAPGFANAYSGRTGNLLYSFVATKSFEKLGWAVADAGDANADGFGDLIVGAPTGKAFPTGSGDARVYSGCDCAPSAYCTAKTNSAGCTPTIHHFGVLRLSGEDNFHVLASNVLNSKAGIMLWSQSPASTPFGGGTLCLAPPIRRTPGQSSGGSLPPTLDCTGHYDFAFTHAYLAAFGLPAGTLLHAQFWSRDQGFAPPTNIGLTNALAFEVCP